MKRNLSEVNSSDYHSTEIVYIYCLKIKLKISKHTLPFLSMKLFLLFAASKLFVAMQGQTYQHSARIEGNVFCKEKPMFCFIVIYAED